MTWGMLRAIVILPGTVLVFVPASLLWATGGLGGALAKPGQPGFWLAAVLGAAGLTFGVWTASLFTRFGEGTPAPWDPPKKLVVLGPYRHVRNPMITSVLAMLAAEALLFQSWPLAAWLAVFFTANAIYFPLSEEPGLAHRFGNDYDRYKAKVPRWLPRLKPWHQP
ncbi:MAG: methyltransferase family protein [Alphaproteobacteria bacterium]